MDHKIVAIDGKILDQEFCDWLESQDVEILEKSTEEIVEQYESEANNVREYNV